MSIVEYRIAAHGDVDEIASLDALSPERLRQKVEREELLVAIDQGRLVGSLRFGFM